MGARKHLNILEYTLSYVVRRKGKNLATVVVFTLIILTVGSIVMLTTSLEGEAEEVLAFAPDITVQKLVAGRQHTLNESYASEIEGIKGVTSVTRRVWGFYYDSSSDLTYTIYGVGGVDETREDNLPLQTGKVELRGKSCLVGRSLAEEKELNVGDKLMLQDYRGRYQKYEVKGIFSSRSELVSGDLVVMPREEARKFFYYGRNEFTDLAVHIANPAEISNIAGKINRHHPELRVLSRQNIKQTYHSIFGWRSGVFLAGLITALLAFAILVWDRASGMSAEEKREIGILKAVGWETRDVLELKTFEALIIAINSYLLGTILSYIHVYIFNATFLRPILIGWSTLYPEFSLQPVIGFEELLAILFVSLLPYLAAVIVPSWRASTIPPEEVMRGS